MKYLQRKNKKLVNEFHTCEFIKNTDLDGKVKNIPTKAELKAEKNKISELETFC